MKKFIEFTRVNELSTKKLVQYGRASKKDVDNQMNNRNDKKVVNRVKGGQLARKKILGGAKVLGKNFPKRNESTDLQELSKGTLRNYFNKSYNDSTERLGRAKDNRDLSPADKKKEASRNKYRTIAARKITPKPKSVSARGKAAVAKHQFQKDKANESTEIQELSAHKLVNYSVAARNDALNHSRFRKRNTTPADEKHVKKRMSGDNLAGKKLDRIYKKLDR